MTLSDALELQYVQRKRARPFLESALPIPSTDMGQASSARSITPNIETRLTKQSLAAPPGPSRFKNIQGDFTVLVYAGEKCSFATLCKNVNCYVRDRKWSVRSWPFDCGLLKIGERE